MKNIRLFARAKINLALDVIERLDNGYHNLQMIMQSVSLCDTIYIKKTFNDGICLETNKDWLPIDDKNLVYKAADYLKNEYNIKNGMYIYIKKQIPMCAGLAGGSADCASTLVGIRNLFNLKICNDKLLEIGKSFGADVPFCIKRGTYLAEGIGEKLTPMPPMPHCYMLIVKPSVSISTGAIFQSLDLSKIKERPDIEKINYYIKNENIEGIAANLCNVLETVSIPLYPIIKDIKEAMLESGALGSLMSGSGSAVFGIYKSKKQAILSKNFLEKKLNIKDIFIVKPFNI
nr:4-(cytidine 5'-diphospho)-2-C-methyl-D-erythritol kinase [uncultured Tyzzerella sp.]